MNESPLATGDEPNDRGAGRAVVHARWIALGLLFAIAFGARVYRIDEPPLDFAVTRQYHGASLARALYYEATGSVRDRERRVAALNAEHEGTFEPPVLETMASIGYRIRGAEELWIPRTLSVAFWLLGGVLLLRLARRIGSAEGAPVAVAFYLFVPFGIAASRSFQPDSLMVMMLLAASDAILSFHRHPSPRRLAIAGIVSGMAVLAKPMCVFAIGVTFFCLNVQRQGMRRALSGRRLLAFACLSLGPCAVYFGYQLLYPSSVRRFAGTILVPRLWITRTLWLGWWTQIRKVIGAGAVLGSAIGFFTLPRADGRAMLLGLWLGYLLLGLVFDYHIHTHSYYSLQIVPVAALSLGALAAWIVRRLRPSRIAAVVPWVAAAVVVGLGLGGARGLIGVDDWRRRVRIYEEIGNAVNHSMAAVWITENYGGPLRYHGHVAGSAWPTQIDLRANELLGRASPDVESRWTELLRQKRPEFFIVTEPDELAAQPDLKRLLATRYRKLAETAEYVIYDLRRAAIPNAEPP